MIDGLPSEACEVVLPARRTRVVARRRTPDVVDSMHTFAALDARLYAVRTLPVGNGVGRTPDALHRGSVDVVARRTLDAPNNTNESFPLKRRSRSSKPRLNQRQNIYFLFLMCLILSFLYITMRGTETMVYSCQQHVLWLSGKRPNVYHMLWIAAV